MLHKILSNQLNEGLISRLQLINIHPKKIFLVECDQIELKKLLSDLFPRVVFISEQELAIKKNNDVDLIVANMCLPWLDVKISLVKWRHFLRTDGVLLLTSLGPDSFCEIKGLELLPKLIDMHDLGDNLLKLKFTSPVLDVEKYTLKYFSLEKLNLELKAAKIFKTNNLNCFRAEDGSIKITVEVVYGHAFCVKNDDNEFHIPVTSIKIFS